MVTFQLGIDAGDHLYVEIHEWLDVGGDWLNATIRVSAGAFSGQYDALLNTCEFPSFRSELESLYKSLDGVARFDTMERQLEVTCTGNGRGGVSVQGIAQDTYGDGNLLKFQFEIDQTYLPKIIAQLREIESKYPNP